MTYCPREGKIQYGTSREAKRALREIQRRKTKRGAKKGTAPIGVYECPWCGRWHMTSRKPLKKAA